MAATQDDISDLNKMIDDIMRESVEAVEEVHPEPQPGEGINVKKEPSQKKNSRRLHKGMQRDKGQMSTQRKKQQNTTRTHFNRSS